MKKYSISRVLFDENENIIEDVKLGGYFRTVLGGYLKFLFRVVPELVKYHKKYKAKEMEYKGSSVLKLINGLRVAFFLDVYEKQDGEYYPIESKAI